MKSKPKDIPEIVVPCGYILEDFFDIDDSGFDFEEAILYEEVKVRFERKDTTTKRV